MHAGEYNQITGLSNAEDISRRTGSQIRQVYQWGLGVIMEAVSTK